MSNLSYYAINTIFFQKIREFFSEFQSTIISPLVSTIIFVVILSTVRNYYSLDEKGNYLNFVVPGIIIMTVMQVSYQNISESLIFMKQIGSFNDYLMSPMSRTEILISLLIASIFIGLFTGLVNIIVLTFFVKFYSFNFLMIFYYLFLTSLIFSSIGSIIGFLFFTWDIQSSISNFIVVPISFLSGTFFSIHAIDPKWMFLFKINPFYYLVNKFRLSFYDEYYINIKEESFLFFFSIIFLIMSIFIYKKGYKTIY
ncbi:MAG: ABC transporter permease [Pelagibacteraceae bacterium]|jgi:ABC-2 type transport system permease protein|nr:ABC transporter permease [Pelagibacteraceae bacterium]MBO6470450.1 ABC transporter permease [Pelagibacteraceae bacterium]MBO6470834.1 ABC transporter permease [Pelagibacteraceae bacterium]MBO6478808.1 ABC transporter permease [Pelagibacteraceae bacterium]HJO13865.1 ABC transporter permease [Alphaproteobacteria bacterium]|tara:strand:- start:804 stop:1568 length:765 start_codon:yes stop_codon:yes gene_type:complete